MPFCGCEFVDTYEVEVLNASSRPLEVTFSTNGEDSTVVVEGETPVIICSEEGGPHGWAQHRSRSGPHDDFEVLLESLRVRQMGGPASNKDYSLEDSWWFRDGTFRAYVTDEEFD